MHETAGAEVAQPRRVLPGAAERVPRVSSIARRDGGPIARALGRLLAAAGHGSLGVAIRVGAMATAAVVVAVIHRVHDPGTLCPFRAVTGVPCPVCGGTTVFIELGSGHPVAALGANPLVLVGAIGLATAPLGPGRVWWAIDSRTRAWLLGTVLGLSWLWQLGRFGLLRF